MTLLLAPLSNRSNAKVKGSFAHPEFANTQGRTAFVIEDIIDTNRFEPPFKVLLQAQVIRIESLSSWYIRFGSRQIR